MENEGTLEAVGQGLADSRAQLDLRHHLRNIRKAEALLPGFCFRGNSFTGPSHGRDWKKGTETGREGERKGLGRRKTEESGGRAGKQTENSKAKEGQEGMGGRRRGK